MTDGHIHIQKLARIQTCSPDKKPASIVFILEQNGFSKNKELST